MNLLAVSNGWILDVVFIAILLVGLVIGICRGFVKGICKLAGTIFSIVFAFTFCVPMKNQLDAWFNLTGAMGGSVLADWGAVVISFVALVVLIKLAAWLLGKLGSALVDKFTPLKIVNKILGGILGVAKALLFVFIVLAVLRWIGVGAVNDYIAQTTIMKGIYFSDWFLQAFIPPRV